MRKSIYVVAVAFALTAVLPAARAQQGEPPPKQSLSAKIKQKYLERRAEFVSRAKNIYFAVGCKVLSSEAGMHSTGKDSYLAYIREQVILDLKEDQQLVEAARQEGLNRAAKPGECDYYRRHPEAAEAVRRQAAEASKQ